MLLRFKYSVAYFFLVRAQRALADAHARDAEDARYAAARRKRANRACARAGERVAHFDILLRRAQNIEDAARLVAEHNARERTTMEARVHASMAHARARIDVHA